LKEKFMKSSAIDTQMKKETVSSFSLAMAHLKSVRELHVADGADKEECEVSELGKRKGGGGGPKDKRKKKGGGAGGAGGGLQLHGYSNKEWFDLPEATKAKVKAGRAAEKAAKRAATAASSAKADEADKEASSSARVLTPELIGRLRRWNRLSRRPSRRILLQDPICHQGHSQ
jgi:hypothetical protein